MSISKLDKALDAAFAEINVNTPFLEIERSKRNRLYRLHKKSSNLRLVFQTRSKQLR